MAEQQTIVIKVEFPEDVMADLKAIRALLEEQQLREHMRAECTFNRIDEPFLRTLPGLDAGAQEAA